MLTDAASKPREFTDTRTASRNASRLITRRIWLPKVIYNSLPFFYVFAGVMALLATLYISAWFWILPHYLLFSVACLHMGILIYRRRHRR